MRSIGSPPANYPSSKDQIQPSLSALILCEDLFRADDALMQSCNGVIVADRRIWRTIFLIFMMGDAVMRIHAHLYQY